MRRSDGLPPRWVPARPVGSLARVPPDHPSGPSATDGHGSGDAPVPPTVEVFADVLCPFAHVGLRRFVDRRDELGRTGPRLRVRAWPLELINGRPLQADHVADELDPIRHDAAPCQFAGFDLVHFPTTSLPAFALTAAAYEVSDEIGERIALEVRDALFERGLDVGDRPVLDELARRHGIAYDAEAGRAVAEADLAEGRDRGVVGSPHFFTPDGGFFCPSLDVHRDEHDQLVVHRDPEGFDRFLAAALA